MKIKWFLLFSGFFLLISIHTSCNKRTSKNPVDEIYAWSHNDYEQPQPLISAIDLGYQMIEADIHLIDGVLYVVHDHPKNPDQTPRLGELYLEPLMEIAKMNNGEVLPGDHRFFYLVIDVKTEAESTFKALMNSLEPYKELFSRKEEGNWIEGPVRLLISGNRPVLDPESTNQMVFLDGRIQNIGMGFSPELYPVISDNWFKYFSWDGTGEIPDAEREKLQKYVRQVHEEDKMIRFWGLPDKEQIWRVLIDNGVDIINVDDLQGFQNFLDTEFRPE